ncbi:MAG: nuclear transport factor 2 family protein [Solirubrobacterales bacterium]
MASSEERDRVARAGLEAFNAGDTAAVIELLAGDVEVFSSPALANAGSFRGREGYLQWIAPWVEAWQGLEVKVERTTPVGERHVVAEVHQVGHGRDGIKVSMDVAFLFEVSEQGRISYLGLHPDPSAVIADARVRERG